jgi:hypothetical protein
MAKRIFVSHISEESETALQLKAAIEADFLGFVDVFVSSDTESITAGEQWLASIDAALQEAGMLLILCSAASVARPWINFEAGAAWMRKIPLVPVCHAGLTPRDLPIPLSLRQGVALADANGLRRLYSLIAEVLGCRVPPRHFDDLAANLAGTRAAPVPTPSASSGSHNDIRDRLQAALKHPRHKWRTLAKLAAIAAVSEDVAAQVLRADRGVRFSRNPQGEVIAGLISRVGPG